MGAAGTASSRKAMVQRWPARYPISTAPGSRSVSLISAAATGSADTLVSEIDRLHQRVRDARAYTSS